MLVDALVLAYCLNNLMQYSNQMGYVWMNEWYKAYYKCTGIIAALCIIKFMDPLDMRLYSIQIIVSFEINWFNVFF